jgi:probable nitrogen fixation protein
VSAEPGSQPFTRALASLVRAHDLHGASERYDDEALLRPFVVSRETRRGLPVIGDPGPEVLVRVEQFYKAVCTRLEQRCGLMASPLLVLSHEGFGRVVVVVGKLVVYAKTLRDVHRFGFEDLPTLERDGERVVEEAVKTIDAFPEVARA